VARAAISGAFGGVAPTGVAHLGSLDVPAAESHAAALESTLTRGYESVLATVHALGALAYRDPPRLWIVTRGAQATANGEDAAVEQAAVIGLARTIAMEHAELRCCRVDLDRGAPEGELAALVAELVADDTEEEVALRGASRRVSRIVPGEVRASVSEREEPAAGRAFRLTIDRPGSLDRLALRPFAANPPGPGEVQIAVEAAGLNFLDVLLAMGVMPHEGPGGPPLGGECAGRVVALGEGVLGLTVGQPVVALGGPAFGTHVVTPALLVLPRPARLSAIEGAAMPTAYMSAWYSLAKVARLSRGERVLIHSATGGVGLAAVQWAQHVGAEVFATVGSPEKRVYLESLGVKYVSDSRSDRFVRDVLAWTGGEGVDVVLNSLSGELIEKSFGLLRDHGRFIELGKRDYYANNRIGLQPFLRNLSFSLVDLRAMIMKKPAQVRELFAELATLLESGVFTPPPVEAFPISDAPSAFRKMAQAQHVGKIVLTVKDEGARVRVAQATEVAVRGDASYLVTGGLGGLGLSVSEWLAKKGAGHLVLVGRSGVTTDAQRAAIAAIEAHGAKVSVVQGDVGKREDVERAVGAASASGKALRGVIHAAGVLDDGILLQQTAARLRTVFAPKALGAMHLHDLTRGAPLDFFVTYGSASGLLGAPGQGNYAAANALLDALAHHRRAHGLPATSIDWGPFAEVGMAAAQANRGERMGAHGMRSLTPAEGLAALERLIASDATQMGVMPINVRQWVEVFPAAAASRRLSRLVESQRAAAARPTGDRKLLDRIAAASGAGRVAIVEAFLRAQASEVLRIPEAKLDVESPLTNLGMDSLMGLELRNRIEAGLGISVPATLLWTYPTVRALAAQLLPDDAAAAGEAAPEPPPDAQVTAQASAEAAAEAVASDVREMNTDALLAFLDEELARARQGTES
jgi:NADPH:quinone reductase-like Zn-dependent oxidoreductase/acyl carrier protein